MVKVIFDKKFQKIFSKIKDNISKEKVIRQIEKIKENPEIGKPMRYDRRGSRELYTGSFRLSYSFSVHENTIYLLDLYHKDEQ